VCRCEEITTGHSKINVTTQFNPIDVVTTTTAGHIIVSDYDTHALHVLSEQGDILTCKVMKDMGIKYPFSLEFDMRGQLYFCLCLHFDKVALNSI
jgi:hypothetical protein